MLDCLLLFLTEDFWFPFDRATLFRQGINLVPRQSKPSDDPLADRYNKLFLAIFGVIDGVSCLLLLDVSFLSFHTTTSVVKVITFIVLCMLGVSKPPYRYSPV
eukprot:gb/GEZJ01003939.1/.p4 GENE.gb/GEZJ01003939.1/~~gb/GEZJ01003939.1/.p4  ORF type:complete len:103 (-),score=7.19 gb/GEZJ01003939.1/:1764-2072(-)